MIELLTPLAVVLTPIALMVVPPCIARWRGWGD